MLIEERTVAMSQANDRTKASEVGWFAARQPGLLRFIEDRLSGNDDALAMAVDLCWRVTSAYEQQRGLPLPRLLVSALEEAEVEVVTESQGGLPLANGCAHRQPELCRWLEAMMATPVLPIERVALDQIALIVAATISACDRAHFAHGSPNEDHSVGVLVG
jgi:hypothetical protein